MAAAKKTSKIKKLDRLPNAPLAEVVLELRWELVGNVPFKSDPGIMPLLDAFSSGAKKLGFPVTRDMGKAQEVVGHSVLKRYYPSSDVSFPILQIGQGVFAFNQSSEYEWRTFKKMALDGLKVLTQSYPVLKNFPLRPEYVELRYVDVFDDSLIGTLDLVQFANKATHLGIELPPLIADKKVFTGKSNGRLILSNELKGRKDTSLVFDLGSGINSETQQPVVRLETKVTSGKAGIPKFSSGSKFIDDMSKWLEYAHDVTSPFFRELIRPEIMKQFEKKK